MEVKIQISDNVYAQLLNGTKRMRGTIGLVNPTEGNFSEHRRWEPKPGTQYMRLPHGKVSVCDGNVRMNLRIASDEMVDAPQAILGESIDASNFVEIITDEHLNERACRWPGRRHGWHCSLAMRSTTRV